MKLRICFIFYVNIKIHYGNDIVIIALDRLKKFQFLIARESVCTKNCPLIIFNGNFWL